MLNNRIFFYVLLILTCTACRPGTLSEEYQTIMIPENIVFTRFVTDTVYPDFSKSRMKILTFADSEGCMGCKLQLDKWKELIETVHAMKGDSISFLFFFDPLDLDEMSYLLFSSDFEYPVVIDSEKQMKNLNGFSSDITFLLDENNNVLILGNPVLDSDIKTLYLQKIKGEASTSDIKTTVEIEQTNIAVDNLKNGETESVFISIKNTGDAPLIIYGIDTSCGCVKADFEKGPLFREQNQPFYYRLHLPTLGFLVKQ